MIAPAAFLGREIAIAVAVAALAQMAFVGLFLLPPPPAIEADFSDDQSKPLSVAITPVPLLKLGSKHPAKLPSSWQRAPAAAKAALPHDPRDTTAPSTKASPADQPSTRDAGLLVADSAVPETPAAAPIAEAGITDSGPAPASTQLGAANGSADGTETDPLKARAADIYRAQLASWFAARFAIRGKVPFEKLKTLSATVVVSVSADRRVTGFSVSRSSGEHAFDEEVAATLTRIQSSGAELPAPPPAYPEMLTRTVPVSFRCTSQSQCE